MKSLCRKGGIYDKQHNSAWFDFTFDRGGNGFHHTAAFIACSHEHLFLPAALWHGVRLHKLSTARNKAGIFLQKKSTKP